MAENTKIEWTDFTFNLVWGCWKTSPGCANCFADAWDGRFGGGHWGVGAPRQLQSEGYWKKPLEWNKKAMRDGVRRRVFCSSMTDVFLDEPIVHGERAKLWPLIRETPWLDWQLLTKRPENIAANLPEDWGDGWPSVWMGVSIENQEYADKRLPVLAEIPAVIRFVSYEPALGPIDFSRHFEHPNRPDWIICGGESGPDARPFNVAWARSAVQQCQKYGVSPFVKQLGAKPYAFMDVGGASVKADVVLKDKKGGSWEEWDSRFDCIKVREFPIDLAERHATMLFDGEDA